MRLLCVLLLTGFYTQPINAASAGTGTKAHAGSWKPSGPLLDILRYTPPTSVTYHPDATIEDYFARMDREGNPRVLIVGCGHYDIEVQSHVDCAWLDSNHIHPDAWCVDIEDPSKFDPMVTVYKKEGYVPDYKDRLRKIKANDRLDITTTDFPRHYVGQFDIVLLERIWSKPLSNPYTYYNSAQALRPEGYLFIEFRPGYGVGDPYFDRIATFAGDILTIIKPKYEERILDWFRSMPRDDSEQEDITKAMQHCASLYGGSSPFSLSHSSAKTLDFFLRCLFFEAVAATNHMISPFSGRGTSFVLAKKTDLTQELLEPYTPDEVKAANNDKNNERSLPWSLELGVDHEHRIAMLSILFNPLLDAIRAVYPHGME